MENTKINRDKVVFINLTKMEKYDGIENALSGGGQFVDENGYGHEIYNFSNDNEKCYGYTPPTSKIKLERISNEIIRDQTGVEYIDDVLVIFTNSQKTSGRIICGFYLHARVYRNPVDDNRASRKFNEEFIKYNIVCEFNNTFLLPLDDRTKSLPHSSSKEGNGHGQSPIWYVDEPERQILKNKLVDYVENLIIQPYSNDEIKYYLYDESKIYVSTIEQNRRSQEARNKCISDKGCYCNICGFDFEKVYGELGKKHIEVHHITPIKELSTSKSYGGTDSKTDLIPVCSNCHSMIHKQRVPYHPDQIKELLEKS